MRVVEMNPAATPRQWGRAHGESLRQEIAEIAEIRLALCRQLGGFEDTEALLALARRHMAVLSAFDRDLHEEVLGIAEGSGVDLGRVVILNHFTDLRDLGPAQAGEHGSEEEDCTTALVRTPEGMLLGQTWDMHGSAADYVVMIHVPACGDVPEAWLLSIAGCVGMTGMNAHGVGVTINNLLSLDARVGVVWPALVRRLLREPDAPSAHKVLMGAPVGSGHYYVVADAEGAFGVETSGQHKRLVFQGADGPHIHTNHCLDATIHACSTVAPESTTHSRYAHLQQSIEARAIDSMADLWSRFADHTGYPHSICTHLATPEAPHAIATCGGLVMNLSARAMWGAQGCLVENPHQTFTFC